MAAADDGDNLDLVESRSRDAAANPARPGTFSCNRVSVIVGKLRDAPRSHGSHELRRSRVARDSLEERLLLEAFESLSDIVVISGAPTSAMISWL